MVATAGALAFDIDQAQNLPRVSFRDFVCETVKEREREREGDVQLAHLGQVELWPNLRARVGGIGSPLATHGLAGLRHRRESAQRRFEARLGQQKTWRDGARHFLSRNGLRTPRYRVQPVLFALLFTATITLRGNGE